MATIKPSIPKDPNFSKGVNLSGFNAADILQKFNQVAVVNGSQKIILSTDTADSDAANNLKTLAGKAGSLATIKPASGGGSSSKGTSKPGKSSSLKTWLIVGGSAAAGLAILVVVFLATKKKG